MKLMVALVFAVVFAFVLGAAGGYAARGLTAAAAPPGAGRAESACPAGQYAVVWYTARTWACEPNS